MTADTSSSTTHARIHWLLLFLRLPTCGIDVEFPTESACENRLIQVRWPNGPICPTCSEKDIGHLTARNLYHCRFCQKQFSLGSGTLFHRRRVGLRTYFSLAEGLIERRATGFSRIPSTGHGIKNHFNLAYQTAVNLKKNVLNDLTKDGGGLIGHSICVRPFTKPQDVELEGQSYELWLQHTLRRRLSEPDNIE